MDDDEVHRITDCEACQRKDYGKLDAKVLGCRHGSLLTVCVYTSSDIKFHSTKIVTAFVMQESLPKL